MWVKWSNWPYSANILNISLLPFVIMFFNIKAMLSETKRSAVDLGLDQEPLTIGDVWLQVVKEKKKKKDLAADTDPEGSETFRRIWIRKEFEVKLL